MKKILAALATLLATVLGLFFVSFLLAYPTKWAANYLLSPGFIFSVFGAYQLTVWKAWALNFITTSLFKASVSK